MTRLKLASNLRSHVIDKVTLVKSTKKSSPAVQMRAEALLALLFRKELRKTVLYIPKLYENLAIAKFV